MVVSVTVAAQGAASLAVPNAAGGVAARTPFLAVGDLTYRRADLEHAAAEPADPFRAVHPMILPTLPLAAYAGPEVAYLGVHPASLAMFAAYLAGLRVAARGQAGPRGSHLARGRDPRDARRGRGRGG